MIYWFRILGNGHKQRLVGDVEVICYILLRLFLRGLLEEGLLYISKVSERFEQLRSVTCYSSLDKFVVGRSAAVRLDEGSHLRVKFLLDIRLILSGLLEASVVLRQELALHLQRFFVDRATTKVSARTYNEEVLDHLDGLAGMPLEVVPACQVSSDIGPNIVSVVS